MGLTRKQRYLRSLGYRFGIGSAIVPALKHAAKEIGVHAGGHVAGHAVVHAATHAAKQGQNNVNEEPTPEKPNAQMAPPPVNSNTMVSVKDIIGHHKAHEDIHRRGYEKFKDSEFPDSKKIAEQHKQRWHHHAGVRTRYEAMDRVGKTHVSLQEYKRDSSGKFASFSLSLVDEVVLAGVSFGVADRDWMKPKGVKPVVESAKRAGSEFMQSAKALVTPGNIGATAGMTLVFVIGSAIAMTAVSLVLRGLGIVYQTIGNKIFVKPKNEQQAQKVRSALKAKGAKEVSSEEVEAAFGFAMALPAGYGRNYPEKPKPPDRFAKARAEKHARQVLPRAHYIVPLATIDLFRGGFEDLQNITYKGHKLEMKMTRYRDPNFEQSKKWWVKVDIEADDPSILHSVDNLAMRCKARHLDSRGNMEAKTIEPTARVPSPKARPDQLRCVFTFPEKQAKELAPQVRRMGARVELKGYTFGRNYHVPAMIMMVEAPDEKALSFIKKFLHGEAGSNTREVGYGEWLRAVARDKGVPEMSHGAHALRHKHNVEFATNVTHSLKMLGGLKKMLSEWVVARKAGDEARLLSIWQKVQNILQISKGVVENPKGGVRVLAATATRNPTHQAKLMEKSKKSMPYDLGRWLSEKMPSLFPTGAA